LFEQVLSFVGRERVDELFLGCGQDALEADHKEVADQVGVWVAGPYIPVQSD
jgi:hypothetical protein